MRTTLLVLTLSSALMPLHADEARAQSGTPHDDICLAIDEGRDTLSPQERTSAIRLLSAQFELAGRRVVAEGCTVRYTLAHIALGQTIFVMLSGADYIREGKAIGLDDLPALYSQIVWSIVTGRPMTGFNVVDRTNVTVAQTSANRVHSDAYAYARLGYGSIFADRAYGAPSVGFGWRVELDSFGLDVSFLNLQSGDNGYGSTGGASAGSLVKLQGLHFLRPTANASTIPWRRTGLGIRDGGHRRKVRHRDLHLGLEWQRPSGRADDRVRVCARQHGAGLRRRECGVAILPAAVGKLLVCETGSRDDRRRWRAVCAVAGGLRRHRVAAEPELEIGASRGVITETGRRRAQGDAACTWQRRLRQNPPRPGAGLA